jgi:hypothetical protein
MKKFLTLTILALALVAGPAGVAVLNSAHPRPATAADYPDITVTKMLDLGLLF